MIGIDYSDSTPDVSFTYNRLGQQKTITDSQGSRTFTYNDALQLASETNAMGLITRSYDSLGRNVGFGFGPDYSVSYGFEGVGRFNSVSSSVQSASSVANYFYLQNSDLISVISNLQSVITTKSYESNRNLITQLKNMAGGNVISQFDYTNDQLGRRTQRIDTLAVTNTFGYNLKSELVAASMGTNSYNYLYDNIGNRLQATNNAENLTYLCNSLNQYTNIANGVTNRLRYDYDGNLTNDGIYAYAWDGENRLISVTPLSLSNGSKRVKCYYDYMSRRFRKDVDNWNGSWVGESTNKFIYDGWNVVCEIIQGSSVVTNYYVWGLDLSGSLQGAGGIGGLIARRDTAGTNEVYYFCDANGNITDVVNTNGTSVAHYEYDPYGNVISSSGAEAGSNKIRFSSKYWDDETGLGYWGYRYYDAGQGRWVGRDRVGEGGGINLYGYCRNEPVEGFDYIGLMKGVPPNPAIETTTLPRGYFGMTSHTLLQNFCGCKCDKNKYRLSCTFSVLCQRYISVKGAPIWQIEPYSFPDDPAPDNWASMTYEQKWENILRHETRHYSAYERTYNKRKYIIEGFEMLNYQSANECNQRKQIIEADNEKAWRDEEKRQKDYDSQGHY